MAGRMMGETALLFGAASGPGEGPARLVSQGAVGSGFGNAQHSDAPLALTKAQAVPARCAQGRHANIRDDGMLGRPLFCGAAAYTHSGGYLAGSQHSYQIRDLYGDCR